MTGFLIGVLTLFIILDCLMLLLLVLMQQPKKETGGGLAFGGMATDALFGAGSGNLLTKATKYAAIGFFGLSIILSLVVTRHFRGDQTEFRRQLERQGQQPPAGMPGPAPTPA